MVRLRALTLWQPWASLIAAGFKTVETRSWEPSSSCIGELLVIHAGKRVQRKGLNPQTEAAMAGWYGRNWDTTVPCGAAIAVVRLAGAFRVAWHKSYYEEDGEERVYAYPRYSYPDSDIQGRRVCTDPFGDFAAGRWVWLLEDVQPLEAPLPMRGGQRIWTAELSLSGLQTPRPSHNLV